MKKTLIALLALSSVALGEAVKVNSDGTLSSTGEQYVYAWTSDSNQSKMWGYLAKDTVNGELTYTGGGYHPAGGNDGAIIGYTYNNQDGKFAAENGTTSSGFSFNDIGADEAYFNGTVSVSGGDINSDTIHLTQNTTITVSADLGIKGALTLDFGDMTESNSCFTHNAHDIWTNNTGSVTLSGSYTFSQSVAPKTIFSYNAFNGNDLTFTNAFVVTDANGTVLTNIGIIRDMEMLEMGQSAVLWSGNTLQLVANASVPEPTTGSLSLLALAGLCIRRRK